MDIRAAEISAILKQQIQNFGAEAEVRLAEKPSERVLGDIKAALRDVAKAEVNVDVKIDPALIGGLVVRLGHRMVDASLRTKLNAIRLAMREAR